MCISACNSLSLCAHRSLLSICAALFNTTWKLIFSFLHSAPKECKNLLILLNSTDSCYEFCISLLHWHFTLYWILRLHYHLGKCYGIKSMRKRILWESDSILNDSDNTTRKVGSHLSSFACDYLCQSFRRCFFSLLQNYRYVCAGVYLYRCIIVSSLCASFSLQSVSTLAVFML